MKLDREFYVNQDPTVKRSFNLFHLFDPEGNQLDEFQSTGEIGIHGKKFFVNSGSYRANFVSDKEDNIFMTYQFLNKIERYSADYRLLFQASRKLDYPVDVLSVSPDTEKLTRVSRDICLDTENRIWVLSLKRQEKEEEELSINSEVMLAREMQSNRILHPEI